jgi:F0F1-type ATP synthase assembly protein I
MNPTEEQTYRQGVNDKLEEITTSLEEQRRVSYSTANSLSRIEIKTEAIETQAKYTNGKVRKMIIALVFLGGIVIGQQFGSVHDIIKLVASAI